jgi:hypothetical protein
MNSIVIFQCECGKQLDELFSGELYNQHDCECWSCGRVYDISRPRIELNEKKTDGTHSLYWEARKSKSK